MADKHLAYSASMNTDLFDDDDPLAELARIVGFEPRSDAQPTPAQKQEPAFDLEDELLREFERYDAPRPLHALDRPVEPVVAEPPAAMEDPSAIVPMVEAIQPPIPNHPVAGAAELSLEAVSLDTPFRADAVAEAPLAESWAAEALVPDFFDNADSLSVDLSHDASETVHADDGAPAPEFGLQGDVAASVGRVADARTLMDELELSIASQPIVPAPLPPRSPQWAAASIRLPLANFNAPRRDVAPRLEERPSEHVPVSAVSAPAPAFSESLDVGFQSEHDRHEVLQAPEAVAPVGEPAEPDFDLAASARDGFVPSDAALTNAAYVDVEEAAPAFDIDDLLADVERYPVPQRGAEQPASDIADGPSLKASQPVVAPPAEVSEPPVAAESRTVGEERKLDVRLDSEPDDPFAGHDFDFDLDGIELELADLDFSQSDKPVAASAPQVQAAPPVQQSATIPLAIAPVAQSRPPELSAAPAVFPAPRVSAQRADEPASATFERPEARAVDAEQALPFDPSLIADPEDHPETVADMHVPLLPPVDEEQPVVLAPDYDFDIDAEMASLFEPGPQEAPLRAHQGIASREPVSGVGAAPVSNDEGGRPTGPEDLDEFEQALEEDFRRSYRDPVQPTGNLARMTLESASVAADRRRARSMRGIAAAAALIAVFGLGSYGVYAWLFGGASLGVPSGEPRIIAADKEPVKVAPENPGGKTVPNQDKAVYDRVAGATGEEPKQKALVSSNEEPVDVVQKTLVPEALPLDDGDNAADDLTPTPAGETEDPRLLPDRAAADASSDEDEAPAIMPRKVRTMIVRPDGTLVAREEPAPVVAAAAPAAPAAATAEPTASVAAPVETQPTATAAPFPTNGEIASTDLRASPVESMPVEAPAQPVAESEAAAGTVGENPAQASGPAMVGDTAPVPTARPVEQPVNVVGTVTERGNVHPAPDAPAEVASVSPAQETPVTTAPSGGYGMQIASLPSEAEAKKTYASLSNKFGSVIGGRGVEIRKAEIAGKGTFYRIRIPAGSKDEAADLCERYRQAGGSCLISK